MYEEKKKSICQRERERELWCLMPLSTTFQLFCGRLNLSITSKTKIAVSTHLCTLFIDNFFSFQYIIHFLTNKKIVSLYQSITPYSEKLDISHNVLYNNILLIQF